MTDRPSSQDDLFGSVQEEGGRYVEPSAPLAGRMRPRSLDELVGQDAVIGPGSVLREAVEADQLPSLILWGPPGSGKTTLAMLLASRTKASFEHISAGWGGVGGLRAAGGRAGGGAR